MQAVSDGIDRSRQPLIAGGGQSSMDAWCWMVNFWSGKQMGTIWWDPWKSGSFGETFEFFFLSIETRKIEKSQSSRSDYLHFIQRQWQIPSIDRRNTKKKSRRPISRRHNINNSQHTPQISMSKMHDFVVDWICFSINTTGCNVGPP